MEGMKRLFVAVELPDVLKRRMHSLAGELPQDAIKAVEAGNIHLTLKFLGDTPEDKVAGVIERLEKIRFAQFHCNVSGAGVFPNENYIRVAWVGLQCEEMPKLAAEVERALEGIGKKEERGFSPHITIARVRKKIDVKGFLAKHAGENFGEFGVSEFVLMESELGREGPTYTAIKRFSLER